MEFEACVESLEGARLAKKYGADRIELCSALHEGGLTPGNALLRQIRQNVEIEIYTMIRPVAGGFKYSNEVLDLMGMEIAEMAAEGAEGVVFGVLDSAGHLDLKSNQKLIDRAKSLNLKTVCHRAFDFTPEPFRALEKLIDLGFDRLLTSGQKPKAIEGLALIEKLHSIANDRIEIMAGSGVVPENMSRFMQSSIDAVHFTVGTFEPTLDLGMGARLITDPQKVADLLQYRR